MHINKASKHLQNKAIILMPKAYTDLRPILIERVLNSHNQYLPLETKFLAIHILDHYYYYTSRFDHSDSSSHHYNTHQAAIDIAISIAIKYKKHDILDSQVAHPIYHGQEPVSSQIRKQIERTMLDCVGCALTWCDPIPFLERLIKNDPRGESIRLVAEYYLQFIVMSGYFICLPSGLQASLAFSKAQTLNNIRWVSINLNFPSRMLIQYSQAKMRLSRAILAPSLPSMFKIWNRS